MLSSYNYGRFTAHHELDGELSEAEFRKIDLYATAKGIPAIRDFIRGLDIDNVYCLSMEPHGHEVSKTEFVHDYYGIKKDHCRYVADARQKVGVLNKLYAEHADKEFFCYIDDNASILRDVQNNTRFYTAHVTIFFEDDAVKKADDAILKIGYQGDVGSNSEFAARQRFPATGARFCPLISSAGVAAALINKEIDYGIMAIGNSTAGTVAETAAVLEKYDLCLKATVAMPIRHCLYAASALKPGDISTVVSHIQALKQTAKWRAKHLPRAEAKEVPDQARAAAEIAKYGPKAAVICRKEAGETNGLCLIAENIEDAADNQTVFGVFTCK